MKVLSQRVTWTLGILMMILTALPALANDRVYAHANGRVYQVTVTNLTAGQIFAPPIVYSHRSNFAAFTPGQAASPELAGVAEDADSEPMLALLAAEPGVGDVAIADGVVMPGESTSVRIQLKGSARSISALGMLVTTNDAFFAAGKRVPSSGVSFYAPAWDAGSEANTQDCAHIPGPPCGNGGVRVQDGAEGYVFIHAGIQDRGSLSSEEHDWRNPVALIEIRRVGH